MQTADQKLAKEWHFQLEADQTDSAVLANS